MHAHNRTLIAKLGFADPDRKEPLHDAACRYLTSGDRPVKLMRSCFPNREETTELGVPYRLEGEAALIGVTNLYRTTKWSSHSDCANEVALSKGAEGYKTTIGFIDATASCSLLESVETLQHVAVTTPKPDVPALSASELRAWLENPEWDDGPAVCVPPKMQLTKTSFSHAIRHAVAVEVKITPVSYGELLRQVNLYREYTQTDFEWVAAVAFDVNESYCNVLARERVRVIRLGQAFRDWAAAEQANAVTAKLEEI